MVRLAPCRLTCLFRCESLDGKVHIIAGRDIVWERRDASPGVHTRPRVGDVAAPDDYEFGTARPDDEQWEGEDFTVPTGPPRQVSFLGRAASEIELAPPPHKPFPLQIVIDAHSGLPLREANQAFDTFDKWTELDTDADLADDLFT